MIFLLGIVLMLAGSVIAAVDSGKKDPVNKAERISKVLLCESLAAAFSGLVYWQCCLGRWMRMDISIEAARAHRDASEMGGFATFVISLIIAGISLIFVIVTGKKKKMNGENEASL